MKKACSVILLITILLSMCACAANESTITLEKEHGTTIGAGTTAPVAPTEKGTEATEATEGTKPTEKIPSNTIGFTVPDFDFDFTVSGIEYKNNYSFDFTVPSIDYDFDVKPFEVKANGFTFEFPDYQFSFDVETFDVEIFVEASAENFPEELLAKIPEMETSEVVVIAETRANLLADLSHAFESSGLAVQVDHETGEITLDSSILFEVDQATISPEGEEFLMKFLTVYTTVVCHEKYDGFISKVLVEGHTDSDGNYNYNLTLSQKRADSVKAFCLSKETGLDKSHVAFLEDSMEAKGYSCDKLVYDKDGNEDKAASRRVSFRFLIALP